MPTIVTHGFVAAALGKGLTAGRVPARFWFLSVLCSILPDVDVLGFRLGIRYQDMLGHRGLSHSLVFAIFLSLIVTLLAFPQVRQKWTRFLLFSYFFTVTASHGVLDAMTDGGLGIAFFAPFDNTRYFFPFRPIKVSPIGLAFLSARGLDVAWSEFLWVCIPSSIITGTILGLRKLRRLRASAQPSNEIEPSLLGVRYPVDKGPLRQEARCKQPNGNLS
jgi:inner membrane protein